MYLGERKTISLDGTDAFVADEDVLNVESVQENKITVTAMRGGKTQILYWKNGALTFLDVAVQVPPSLSSGFIGPRFRGNKPYFTYEVQNTSHFSKSTFFDQPGTAHTFQMEDPVSSVGRLRSTFGIRHDGLDTPQWNTALVSYQDPTHYFTFGQTATILGRVGNEALMGTSFVGSNLSFRTPLVSRSRYQKEMIFFGGVRPALSLLDLNTQNQIYGSTVSAVRYIPGRQKADIWSLSGFAYQPLATDAYKPSVLGEGQWHFSKDVSLGLSALKADGGVSGMMNPFVETDRSTSSLKYSFIQHGLKTPLAAAITNDLHRYSLFHQYVLGDRSSTVGGNVAQDFSLQKDDSGVPSSNNLRGSVYFRKQKAFLRGYGLQYGVSRSSFLGNHILLNTLSGNYTYPIKPGNYFQHTLTLTKGDIDLNLQQVMASSSFTHEGHALRSTTSLSTLFSRGDSANESLFFQESFLWNFKHGFYQMGFGYVKADLRDGNHQFLFSPSWNYYLASTHLISLGTNFVILAGDPRETIGTFNVRYRYLFGAGVEKDSLFRNVFKGGLNQPVQGNLFIDRNYSAYYDEGDVPLAGVPVWLGNNKVVTDAAGHFQFYNVKSGNYPLSFDPNNLGIQQPIDVASYQNIDVGGRQSVDVPIPVVYKKAQAHVKVYMDANDNGEIDSKDPIYLWPKVLVHLASGEQRKVSMNSGEAVVKGLEPGSVVIALDAVDIPDTVDIEGPLEQTITVSQTEDLEVNFLVSPVRSIRGQIIFPKNFKKPKNMNVVLGESVSSVDDQGYYWIKKIHPGTYMMRIEGVKGMCLKDNQPIVIPEGPLSGTMNNTLTNDCSLSPSSP